MLDELIKENQTEFQVVAFGLGGEEYATLITNVREIIISQAYTRIPESPHYIKGVINLRGNIIPVIDGRKKFSLEQEPQGLDSREKRIMIMDTEEGTVGLIVDNVLGVVRLNVEEIEPPPFELGDNNDVFWGVGRHQNKLLILINCHKCLTISSNNQADNFKNITNLVKRTKDEERYSGNTAKSG